MLVDALGDEFLARAGLPRDENRGIRRGHLEDLAEDPPHNLALADDLGKELRASTLESMLVTCSDEVELADVVGLLIHGVWTWDFGKAGRFSASRMNFLMGLRMIQVTRSAHRKVNSPMPIPQDFRSHGISMLCFA